MFKLTTEDLQDPNLTLFDCGKFNFTLSGMAAVYAYCDDIDIIPASKYLAKAWEEMITSLGDLSTIRTYVYKCQYSAQPSHRLPGERHNKENYIGIAKGFVFVRNREVVDTLEIEADTQVRQ